MTNNVNTHRATDVFPTVSSRPGQGDLWRPILLRCPVGLLNHIDACAKAGYRTRTAELLARLEASTAGETVDEHGVIVRAGLARSK